MEIIKFTLAEDIIKVEIGDEIDEASKKLTGTVELDIENQSQFVNIINSIFDDGTVKVMVDMVNVSYIDSSGLWALFEGHKKAAQKKGKRGLLRPTKDVKRVLDITKMSSKMKIFEDEPKALACLNE